jgi:hypothetical protein
MWRSNVGSGQNCPDRIIPALGKRPENVVKSTGDDVGRVFKKDVSGANNINCSQDFGKEPATLSCDASALSRR